MNKVYTYLSREASLSPSAAAAISRSFADVPLIWLPALPLEAKDSDSSTGRLRGQAASSAATLGSAVPLQPVVPSATAVVQGCFWRADKVRFDDPSGVLNLVPDPLGPCGALAPCYSDQRQFFTQQLRRPVPVPECDHDSVAAPADEGGGQPPEGLVAAAATLQDYLQLVKGLHADAQQQLSKMQQSSFTLSLLAMWARQLRSGSLDDADVRRLRSDLQVRELGPAFEPKETNHRNSIMIADNYVQSTYGIRQLIVLNLQPAGPW